MSSSQVTQLRTGWGGRSAAPLASTRTWVRRGDLVWRPAGPDPQVPTATCEPRNCATPSHQPAVRTPELGLVVLAPAANHWVQRGRSQRLANVAMPSAPPRAGFGPCKGLGVHVVQRPWFGPLSEAELRRCWKVHIGSVSVKMPWRAATKTARRGRRCNGFARLADHWPRREGPLRSCHGHWRWWVLWPCCCRRCG